MLAKRMLPQDLFWIKNKNTVICAGVLFFIGLKMTDKNIKVLKKCKECNIYPNLDTYEYWNSDHYSFSRCYICPKCLKEIRPKRHQVGISNAEVAQLEWNKANGFDEDDESTWNDDNEKCSKSPYDSIYHKDDKITMEQREVKASVSIRDEGHLKINPLIWHSNREKRNKT